MTLPTVLLNPAPRSKDELSQHPLGDAQDLAHARVSLVFSSLSFIKEILVD